MKQRGRSIWGGSGEEVKRERERELEGVVCVSAIS